MPLTIPGLARLKAKDPYLHEVFTQLLGHINTWQQQSGVAPLGQLPAPPAIGGIQVKAGNGWFDVALTDKGAVQPGVEYFLEWDISPTFANARVEHLGASRNKLLHLGNQTVYFRAYSQYRGSASSAIVNFGNPPTGSVGGGTSAPPTPLPTQGSGTSQVPGSGFGTPANQIQGQQQGLK